MKSLAALFALAVATAACGGGSADSLAPAATAAARFSDSRPLVVNIYVDDAAYEPSIVSIPAGRPVQLVMRNRGLLRHGYQVSGLDLVDSIWFVREPGTIGFDPGNFAALLDPDRPVVDLDSASLDEHEAHHTMGQMAPRFACSAAPDPCGDESRISAEFQPGEVAVLMFTVTTPGRFEVRDPLSAGIGASLIVY